ncbi:protein arginine N-methyltransferase 1.6 [Tanacetum coccineum]
MHMITSSSKAIKPYITKQLPMASSSQLVESTHLWKLHDLFSNQANVADGIRLVPNGKKTILRVKQQQFAMHCAARNQEIQVLSEPFKIFEFEFSKRPDNHGETQLHINTTNDGTVHAVVSRYVLDEEAKIFYSTAPKWITSPFQHNEFSSSYSCNRDWCDHWKQCVWFSKGKGLPVSKDEDVCMDATHTEISISYEFKAQSQISDHDSRPQNSHITLSPERIAIYGDKYWRRSMLDAINYALKGKGSPLCVIADDSVFLTLAVAHLSKSAHIISLFPGLREKGAQYLQTVADENGFSMDRLEVISPSKKQWTMNDTHQKKVDLLIAEPFYFGAEGMLPCQGLQFWSKRTMLDSILSEDLCIMPCKGILQACSMSLPVSEFESADVIYVPFVQEGITLDLWRSRHALENIEGFDHTMVNSTLGACGGLSSSSESPCLPFFIWQCGDVEKLSDACTIMEFDLLKPLSSCQGRAKVEFTEAGVCHGFALWIDWVMDSTNDIVMCQLDQGMIE